MCNAACDGACTEHSASWAVRVWCGWASAAVRRASVWWRHWHARTRAACALSVPRRCDTGRREAVCRGTSWQSAWFSVTFNLILCHCQINYSISWLIVTMWVIWCHCQLILAFACFAVIVTTVLCVGSVMLRLWELQQNVVFMLMQAVCNWRLKDGTELQVFVAEVKKQVVGVAVIRREEVNFMFYDTHAHTNVFFCCDLDLDPMAFDIWRFWSCTCIPKVNLWVRAFGSQCITNRHTYWQVQPNALPLRIHSGNNYNSNTAQNDWSLAEHCNAASSARWNNVQNKQITQHCRLIFKNSFNAINRLINR